MEDYLGLKGFSGVKMEMVPMERKITLWEKLQSLFSGKDSVSCQLSIIFRAPRWREKDEVKKSLFLY